MINKLTILIPVYNEVKLLEEILLKVESVNIGSIEKEIILVDDGSTDGTRDLLKKIQQSKPYKIYYHAKNMGKGAALRTGLTYATGDIILIQDADLEYDPSEYSKLIQPIIDSQTDIVYGSRLANKENTKGFSMLHYLGNKFLTLATNILYGANITDMETCYKVFRYDVIKNMQIKSNKFDFEPEISAKILKRKHKIIEIPITYKGRAFEEGKKITWRDGIDALWTLFVYRFVD